MSKIDTKEALCMPQAVNATLNLYQSLDSMIVCLFFLFFLFFFFQNVFLYKRTMPQTNMSMGYSGLLIAKVFFYKCSYFLLSGFSPFGLRCKNLFEKREADLLCREISWHCCCEI